MRKTALTFFLIVGFVLQSSSQNVILESSEDAKAFLGSYFSPFSQTLGAGLNNGWYNTAKPHKPAGFDVSLSINLVSVTDENKLFNVNELDHFSASPNTTPTILGNGSGSEITYDNGQGISGTFTMPEQDFDIPFVPVPTLNAGIGLFKGTELNVRYIPDYAFDIGLIGQGSIGLYGGGLKHDILQWIPLAKKLPFDLSVQAAFNQLNTSFEVESQSVDQEVKMTVNSSTYNLIISKKLAILTAYASAGLSSTSSRFEGNTSFQLGSTQVIEFNVPLDIDFERQTYLQASAGVRIKLAIFTITASQSFSEFPTTSAGIGISFR